MSHKGDICDCYPNILGIHVLDRGSPTQWDGTMIQDILILYTHNDKLRYQAILFSAVTIYSWNDGQLDSR